MSLQEIVVSDFEKYGIKIKHHDHHGYVYNNDLKCYDEEKKEFLSHSLDHNIKECIKIDDSHDHHEYSQIPHLDHLDYIVGNRLHFVHDDHCDDHGELILEQDTIQHKGQYWRFILMIILTGSFFFVELVTGIIIESLALQADSFHMLADVFALMIAFYSVILSKKAATDKATFGWVRAEIIGALVNGVFLISACLFISIEAVHKFREFKELENTLGKQVDVLIIVGSIGLGINLIGIIVFVTGGNGGNKDSGHSHGHSHNLNIRAILLHIMGDVLGSIGVVVSGIIIKFVDSEYRFLADPLVSIIIVILIMWNAVPLVKQCVHILLHKVPKNVNVESIRKEMTKIDGVINIHHLHVWQLDDSRVIGSLHVLLEEKLDFYQIYEKIQNILHMNGVHATTIQQEIYDKRDHKCKNIRCDNCQEKVCC